MLTFNKYEDYNFKFLPKPIYTNSSLLLPNDLFKRITIEKQFKLVVDEHKENCQRV